MSTDKIGYWLFGDRTPVTKSLILVNAVTFVMVYLARSVWVLMQGGFEASSVLQKPWTAVTYPLIGDYGCPSSAVFSLAFACYWLWIAGGSLERTWGSQRFVTFFAEVCALTALGAYVGMLLTGQSSIMLGLWAPLAGVTVAFAALNPEEVVLLMFVLPIKLKYLGMLSAAALLVAMSRFHPVVGICSLLGCAFSYWYVKTGRHYGVAPRRARPDNVIRVHERESPLSRLNPLSWIKRHRARRRLRKLFEDSGFNEDDRSP